MKICWYQDHDLEALRVWNTGDITMSLKDQGIECDSIWASDPDFNFLVNYDVVIFYRSLMKDYSEVINKLKDAGVWVGFSIDDLIWDKRFPIVYQNSYETNMKSICALVDFYVLPSDFLNKFMPDPSKPTIYRRGAIYEKRFGSVYPPEPHKDFRILISKTEIQSDIRCMYDEIFNTCKINYPIEVFYFSNYENIFPDQIGSFKFHALQPVGYASWLGKISRLQPDLILNPLPDNDFTNSKCCPKYLEAGAISSCLLASDIYPHKKVIQDMGTGMLAHTPEEFANKIKWAVINREKLKMISLNCHRDVKKNHLLGPEAHRFYETLRNLLDEM